MAIDKTTRRTLSMLLVAAFLGRCVGFCSKPAKSWHASFIPTTLSQPAASVSIMEEEVSQRYLEDPSWFTLLLTTVNSSAKALKMSTLSAALGVWEQYLSEGLIPPGPTPTCTCRSEEATGGEPDAHMFSDARGSV